MKPWLSRRFLRGRRGFEAFGIVRRVAARSLGTVALAAFAVSAAADTMISDNSFLIEEAYNQEAGIVQHILTSEIPLLDVDGASFSFTQEWPLGTQRHQGSFTLPFEFWEGGEAGGIGDLLLNYRLQLGAIGVPWAAAPRFSLVLPTGDESEGRGAGVVGFQLALPLSFEVTPRFAAHGNLGFESLDGVVSPFVGASAVFPIDRRVQALLECVVSSTGADGEVDRSTQAVFSPGLRAAFDRGGVQIVPGIAVPMSFADGESDAALFLYLSLEHAFRRQD